MSFHRWFFGSKVADTEGQPLRVFHGTNQPFLDFDASRFGQNTAAASSIAFFFTEDPREALEYAMLAGRTQIQDATRIEARVERLKAQLALAERRNDWDQAEALYAEWEELEIGAINEEPGGHNIRPVYLQIRRPLEMDMAGGFDGREVCETIKQAKRAGHDGLRLLNVFDPVDARRELFTTTQWVAFKACQVRTAVIPDAMLARKQTRKLSPTRGLEALLGVPSP